MRKAFADRLQRREILGPVEYITADFDPVAHKDRLHLRHHGTLDTIVRISPMLRILGMASPWISDTNTARKTNLSVDNQSIVGERVNHGSSKPAFMGATSACTQKKPQAYSYP